MHWRAAVSYRSRSIRVGPWPAFRFDSGLAAYLVQRMRGQRLTFAHYYSRVVQR